MKPKKDLYSGEEEPCPWKTELKRDLTLGSEMSSPMNSLAQ